MNAKKGKDRFILAHLQDIFWDWRMVGQAHAIGVNDFLITML